MEADPAGGVVARGGQVPGAQERRGAAARVPREQPVGRRVRWAPAPQAVLLPGQARENSGEAGPSWARAVLELSQPVAPEEFPALPRQEPVQTELAEPDGL